MGVRDAGLSRVVRVCMWEVAVAKHISFLFRPTWVLGTRHLVSGPRFAS